MTVDPGTFSHDKCAQQLETLEQPDKLRKQAQESYESLTPRGFGPIKRTKETSGSTTVSPDTAKTITRAMVFGLVS